MITSFPNKPLFQGGSAQSRASTYLSDALQNTVQTSCLPDQFSRSNAIESAQHKSVPRFTKKVQATVLFGTGEDSKKRKAVDTEVHDNGSQVFSWDQLFVAGKVPYEVQKAKDEREKEAKKPRLAQEESSPAPSASSITTLAKSTARASMSTPVSI